MTHTKRPRRPVRKAPGLPPGTVIYTGHERTDEVQIRVIDYTADHLQEVSVTQDNALSQFVNSDSRTWIDVIGVHDTDRLKSIGEQFNLHPLILEDIANTHQQPKLEDQDDFFFMVFRMPRTGANPQEGPTEQISLVVGADFLLSFQEVPGDILDPVRRRLETPGSRIRSGGPDYLAYAILDTVVDHYVSNAQKLGDHIEEMEENLTQDLTSETIHVLQDYKKAVLRMRRVVFPIREVVHQFVSSTSPRIKRPTRPFLRDLLDHANQLTEELTSFRQMLNDMSDLYFSLMSHKMNQIMKFLTIMGTIFIPLTFVVGIYGMNFDYMPELHWRFGYPMAMGVMALIAGILLIYFRFKKWL